MHTIPLTDTNLGLPPVIRSQDGSAEPLNPGHQSELLRFLEQRPVHCAYLTGLIQDNGISNPLNRGGFYAHRDNLGQIQGVALIGHATVIEATNDDSLRALAGAAKTCKATHLVMCEERWAHKLWEYYSTSRTAVRCETSELLFELRWPATVSHNNQHQLRLATVEDLEMLIPVHATMAYEESGVDPRSADYRGFVERYKRRISQGRTWVFTQNDELIFKADVVTETAQTSYVEGIWLNPKIRESGQGRSFMAQLAGMLLWRSPSISLLVNEENTKAQSFYQRCGYRVRGKYKTVFLK